ncbi:1-deoxy-D-xylulose-5-phosphate synthase, partial [Candidatus Pacearchaeota archaeon]|nr:1-deoxy-D-xylulose-5-phosphate synthase [Candidatus Pacearchaeota archaeon]
MLAHYDDPRDAIFEELYKLALNDKDLIILSLDAGAKKFKDFQENMPDQFYNVGISEQNAISVASGLTSLGKKVFVFGIGCFVTSRCYEQIKIDICCMNRSVTIIGMGTGYSYAGDGPTHHITEDLAIMRPLGNLNIWSPSDCTSLTYSLNQAYCNKEPNYIRFDKQLHTAIYNLDDDFSDGIASIRSGKDLTIVSASIMTSRSLQIIEELNEKGIDAGLVDIYRIKPLNDKALLDCLRYSKRIVVLDENSKCGGLCSLVSEFVCEHSLGVPVKLMGINGLYHSVAG